MFGVVGIQLRFLVESQRTDRAPQFRTIVGRLVGVQRSILGERLATLQTDERLDLVVDEAVIFEMVLASERFSTQLTEEWPLIRMDAFVNQQIVGLGEISIAKPAQIFSLCAFQLQGGHRLASAAPAIGFF